MPPESVAIAPAASFSWQACPSAPLAWIELRELVLGWVQTPVLLLPAAAALAAVLAWLLQLPRPVLPAAALLTPLVLSALYSPAATALLSGWLMAQLPAPVSSPPGGDPGALPVVVLVGRGPAIAAATTEAAADRLRRGQALAAYVSGDERATADRLVALGVAPARVAGDACARTTWENATLTAAWLRQRHPGAPVLLITDPWQLPRAANAFQRQGIQVQPLAAEPPLAPVERNRLALRETAATLLYRLQGRM
ncbi:YdcF family protein [Synechococcus sp. CBW1002]|nr:YdcF family protein [Synechococcus sp. CBW1002]